MRVILQCKKLDGFLQAKAKPSTSKSPAGTTPACADVSKFKNDGQDAFDDLPDDASEDVKQKFQDLKAAIAMEKNQQHQPILIGSIMKLKINKFKRNQ